MEKLNDNEDNKYIAILTNQNEVNTHIFRFEKYETYIKGVIESAVSWSYEDGSIGETTYLAKLMIKWDGCSHVYFNGEDYNESEYSKNDEIYPYYHLCGLKDYINFNNGLLFAFKVAAEVLNIDSYEFNLIKQYPDMLKDCSINILKEN